MWWPESQTLSCRGMSSAFCRSRQACNRQRTPQGVQHAQDVLQAQGGFARLQIHDKAHAHACSQCQLRLGQAQLLARVAHGLAECLGRIEWYQRLGLGHVNFLFGKLWGQHGDVARIIYRWGNFGDILATSARKFGTYKGLARHHLMARNAARLTARVLFARRALMLPLLCGVLSSLLMRPFYAVPRTSVS